MRNNTTIEARIPEKHEEAYMITIGNNLFLDIAKDLKAYMHASMYAIVTDSKVKGLYAPALESALNEAGIRFKTFEFPAGEQSKTEETKAKIRDEMASAGFGRDSALIALGGGVAGDLGGYIAHTYMRGVPIVHVPTTLLAMVDSSIGGKTGINTPAGKNIEGAFHFPSAVYASIDTVATLDDINYRNGFAEIIKYAFITNHAHTVLNCLMRDGEMLAGRQQGYRYERMLKAVIKGCINSKVRITEEDPKEKRIRKILNYGHTIGHAIEKLSNYSIPHGYAISMGMVAAAELADIVGILKDKSLIEKQKMLLEMFGLPISIPQNLSSEAILSQTSGDKKAVNCRVQYVLPRMIGEMHMFKAHNWECSAPYAGEIPDKLVLRALENVR
jgi:3-dehydroquinate synthase